MGEGSQPKLPVPATLELYFNLTSKDKIILIISFDLYVTNNGISRSGLEKDVFLPSYIYVPSGARGAFGGHIVSLALTAAAKTVEDGRFLLHSVHAHFISSCCADPLPVFHVERSKDGKTFCNRSVKATQNGRTIFHALVSFHSPEPVTADLVHNDYPMPLAPPPSSSLCVSRKQLFSTFLRHQPPIDFDALKMMYCFPLDKENHSNTTTSKQLV